MIVHVTKHGELTRYADAVGVVVVTPRKDSDPGYLGMSAVSQSDCNSNAQTAAVVVTLEQALNAVRESLPDVITELVREIRSKMESEASVVVWDKKRRGKRG